MQSAGMAALTGCGSGPDEEGFLLPVLPGTLSHLLWVHVGCSVILELAFHLNQMQHAFCFYKDRLLQTVPKSRS